MADRRGGSHGYFEPTKSGTSWLAGTNNNPVDTFPLRLFPGLVIQGAILGPVLLDEATNTKFLYFFG